MELKASELKDLVQTLGYHSACEYILDEAQKAENEVQRRAQDETRHACRNVYSRWHAVSENLLYLAIVLSIASAIIGIPTAIVLNDRRENAAQLTACRKGDTIPCLAAVQEQSNRTSDGRPDPDGQERAKLLRAAYRLATGQELPRLDGER